jgi:hypothetical protein
VVDTTPPLLSCSANKTIVYGSSWTFDVPTATDLNGVTLVVLSTVTNATCGNGFTVIRTWQAMDGCSNAAVCSQTVSVVDQGPPTLLSQPQDQVRPVGATASFGVSISSCPLLGYQWYFNATNSLAGQTDASLVLTNLSLVQAGSYLVIVTNNYGSITSAPALLDVGSAPVISSGPTNQLGSAGGTVTFIVAAQGTDPLSYQWYFNVTNVINGATDATLQLVNLTPAQAGSYAVVVTNRFGSATSASAFLTVGGLPLIIVNPADQVATNGGSALFTVTAEGAAPLTYQWFFNATNLISGAITTTLTLSHVTPANSGTYRVSVSNAVGSVASQDASLRVLVAPRILSITNSGGVITLTFSTVSNLYYEVYYKNSLYDTIWLGLPKTAGQPAPIKRLGTGSPMSVQDVIGSQQRFYTVIAE